MKRLGKENARCVGNYFNPKHVFRLPALESAETLCIIGIILKSLNTHMLFSKIEFVKFVAMNLNLKEAILYIVPKNVAEKHITKIGWLKITETAENIIRLTKNKLKTKGSCIKTKYGMMVKEKNLLMNMALCVHDVVRKKIVSILLPTIHLLTTLSMKIKYCFVEVAIGKFIGVKKRSYLLKKYVSLAVNNFMPKQKRHNIVPENVFQAQLTKKFQKKQKSVKENGRLKIKTRLRFIKENIILTILKSVMSAVDCITLKNLKQEY